MRTFTTGSNNDFVLSDGSLQLSSGLDAVLLVCRHAAQTVLGEMLLAANRGMPYFETVWVGAPTTAPFEAAFRERIAEVDGVTGIEELTTGRAENTLSYTARISTIYGTGVVSG